jgi:hypothetical protein
MLMPNEDYDKAAWDYAIKSEHSLISADLMAEGMQLTLFEIRCLPESWICPIEEKL